MSQRRAREARKEAARIVKPKRSLLALVRDTFRGAAKEVRK
jgi:hypothetical protein